MIRSGQQDLELERVSARIGKAIIDWCEERLFGGAHTFRMEELETAVRAKVGGAPDSTSRIFRSLRQKGQIDYVVENRSQSLYRLRRVGDSEAA